MVFLLNRGKCDYREYWLQSNGCKLLEFPKQSILINLTPQAKVNKVDSVQDYLSFKYQSATPHNLIPSPVNESLNPSNSILQSLISNARKSIRKFVKQYAMLKQLYIYKLHHHRLFSHVDSKLKTVKCRIEWRSIWLQPVPWNWLRKGWIICK